MKEYIGRMLYPLYVYVCEIEWIYKILLFLKRIVVGKKYVYGKYKLSGAKELCGKLNPYKYEVICLAKERKIWKKSFWGETKTYSVYQSPEIYTLSVNNAIVIGNEEGIVVGDYYINDYLKSNYTFMHIYRGGALKSVRKEYAELMFVKPSKSLECAISLVTPAADNYWHYVNELLGKIYCISNERELDGISILVNASVLKNKNLYSLLLMALKNDTEREIIGIENEEAILIKKLIYVSRVSWTPLNVKKGYKLQDKDVLLSDETMKFVRDEISQNVDDGDNGGIKVYLSRKKIRSNRMLDEENVENVFRKYGYEIYYPEKMSAEEQVMLMKKSSVVAGCAGAAMTNMVFCEPTTKVLIIVPREHSSELWANYGAQVELDVKFLEAKIVKKGTFDSLDEFRIDLYYLESVLKEIEESIKNNEE